MSAVESRLRARIEALEIENERLKQAMHAHVEPFLSLKIRPASRVILSLLMKQETVHWEQIRAGLEAFYPTADRRSEITDHQHVRFLRMSLKRYDVTVHNIYGHGFYIEPEAKERLRSLAQG
jgi:hypothetical protein